VLCAESNPISTQHSALSTGRAGAYDSPVKRDLIIALAGVVVVGATAYLLDSIRPPYEPTPSAPHVPRKEQTRPVLNDRVVMHVNGEPVTETEFKLFLRQVPAQMQGFFATPEGRRIAADEVVKLKALEQEGRRLGVDRDPEIAARLDMTRTQVIASTALRKLVPKPSEALVRAEYEKQRSAFEGNELSHILIAYEGGQVPPRAGRPLPEAAATQKARAIATRLRGGADFATLARTQSDDANSAPRGGSLGVISLDALPPELRDVVQNLKAGEISAPAKSAFGIHIFKAGARQMQPFEEVRESLEANVERRQADEAIKRLQRTAKVQLDPKFFPPEPAKRGS
jgi:hypothetical protein